VLVTPANVRDEAVVPDLLAVLAARGVRLASLHGDAGYGFKETARQVEAAGCEPVLAARGRGPAAHGSGLGAVRWVVEQALSHFGNFRRLKVCYERTGAHFQAFHDLAATLLCFKRLQHYTGGL